MKIKRSAKCSLKFANESKLELLAVIRDEYARVVNCYIDLWFEETPIKAELKKGKLNLVDTWFTYRMKQSAAREVIDMIQSSKRLAKQRKTDPRKPIHTGKRMVWSSNTAQVSQTI